MVSTASVGKPAQKDEPQKIIAGVLRTVQVSSTKVSENFEYLAISKISKTTGRVVINIGLRAGDVPVNVLMELDSEGIASVRRWREKNSFSPKKRHFPIDVSEFSGGYLAKECVYLKSASYKFCRRMSATCIPNLERIGSVVPEIIEIAWTLFGRKTVLRKTPPKFDLTQIVGTFIQKLLSL